MGIELVKDRKKKTPISPKKSINKIFFEEGKKKWHLFENVRQHSHASAPISHIRA